MQKNVLNYLSLLFFVGLLILASSFYHENPRENEEAIVHFLDVGQGDSTLVELPNNIQILIDAGPGKAVLEEVGIIMPYYDRKIEHLILSHPHADHLAGFNYILDRYQVEKVYLNGYKNNTPDHDLFLDKIKESGASVQILGRGQTINFDDVQIQVLWPGENRITLSDINDSSLIFYLRKGGSEVLFTGDASSSLQESLLADLTEVDILKVSHHGSRTGVTEKLVDKLNPKYSVISVGEKNRFHHPAQDILDLLRSSRVLRTDELGTISFKLTGSGVILE